MPCMDGGPAPDQREPYDLNSAELEAVLCGVLTKLGDQADAMIESLDHKETGVSPGSAYLWWQNHKRKDRMRQEREAAIKQKRMDEELAELERLKVKYEGGS